MRFYYPSMIYNIYIEKFMKLREAPNTTILSTVPTRNHLHETGEGNFFEEHSREA